MPDAFNDFLKAQMAPIILDTFLDEETCEAVLTSAAIHRGEPLPEADAKELLSEVFGAIFTAQAIDLVKEGHVWVDVGEDGLVLGLTPPGEEKAEDIHETLLETLSQIN